MEQKHWRDDDNNSQIYGTGNEDVDWIKLANDRLKWTASVGKVMSFLVP